MKDAERLETSKTTTSTPRTLRHQQRYQMLVSLYDQALARRPDLAQEFGAEIATLLTENPALAEVFSTLFDRRPHASITALSTSPTLTTVLNGQQRVLNAGPTVQNAGLTVVNAEATVLNGRPSGVEASALTVQNAALGPSPQTPHPPTGGGRKRDLHWEALERSLGPCRTKAERDQRNAACASFRQDGVSPEEIDTISERWPSVMSFQMTAHSMVKYAGQVLQGPQLRQHKQFVNETATKKHQPRMRLSDG